MTWVAVSGRRRVAGMIDLLVILVNGETATA
jgi:hypothetical protein